MNKPGLALLLGLLLVGLFLFAAWVRQPGHPASQWQTSLHRTLEEIDGVPPAGTLGR